MKNITYIFLLLELITWVHCFSEGNIWVSSYSSTRNSTQKCFIHFVTRGRFGFTLISLVQPNATITGVVYFTLDFKRKWIQLQGNFTDVLKFPLVEINSTVKSYSPNKEGVFGKLYNEVETILEVPMTFDSNHTKIIIGKRFSNNLGYHEIFKIDSGKTIPDLDQIIETFYENVTEIPQIPTIYNLPYYSHYGTVIALHIFSILSFIIALLLRNYQPLKSKGVIPFVSL